MTSLTDIFPLDVGDLGSPDGICEQGLHLFQRLLDVFRVHFRVTSEPREVEPGKRGSEGLPEEALEVREAESGRLPPESLKIDVAAKFQPQSSGLPIHRGLPRGDAVQRVVYCEVPAVKDGDDAGVACRLVDAVPNHKTLATRSRVWRSEIDQNRGTYDVLLGLTKIRDGVDV